MSRRFELSVSTQDRGMLEITDLLNQALPAHTTDAALAHVFVKHTSASLVVTGNEDPNLLSDIESYLQRSIPDGDPRYQHNNEGEFDTSGHIRAILTGESKTLPLVDGQLDLGRYQGLFLYEHRAGQNTRTLIITLSWINH